MSTTVISGDAMKPLIDRRLSTQSWDGGTMQDLLDAPPRKRALAHLAGILFFVSPFTAVAQGQRSVPDERVANAKQSEYSTGGADDAECARDQDAAIISAEIVVCAKRADEDDAAFSTRGEASRRYAERTAGRTTPDVEGKIMHSGGKVMSGCYFPPCAKPPAIMIDVTSLPQAPPGSDADRIARGLAPRQGVIAKADEQAEKTTPSGGITDNEPRQDDRAYAEPTDPGH